MEPWWQSWLFAFLQLILVASMFFIGYIVAVFRIRTARVPVYVKEVSRVEWQASLTSTPDDWASGHTLWEAVGSALIRPYPRSPIKIEYHSPWAGRRTDAQVRAS